MTRRHGPTLRDPGHDAVGTEKDTDDDSLAAPACALSPLEQHARNFGLRPEEIRMLRYLIGDDGLTVTIPPTGDPSAFAAKNFLRWLVHNRLAVAHYLRT